MHRYTLAVGKFRFFVLAVVTWLFFCSTSAALAAEESPDLRIVKFWVGKNVYEVNGKEYSMDSAPVVDIQAGRLLMPLRYLAYSLGITDSDIEFKKNTAGSIDEIIVRRPSEGGFRDTLQMFIGQPDFIVNGGEAGTLDALPRIDNGRTLVPYRSAAQALGALVFWDAAERAVVVKTWNRVPSPANPSWSKVILYPGLQKIDRIGVGGTADSLKTKVPVAINGSDGITQFNVIDYLHAWGVPAQNILYDQRGGLMVRGAAGANIPGQPYRAGFIYFYAGEGCGWISNNHKTNPDEGVLANEIKNGQLYSAMPLFYAIGPLFGKQVEGNVSADSLWLRLIS
ncbi:stalk domain-containing protein [Heliobacterium mobile]|uniref:stalk domain-containing protein n=1 Tax=Heliobacterium mobile TaxID=28064 RepID=UPI0012D738B3|nr:stalk domain-containing protein [Heliobacterium mobile]